MRASHRGVYFLFHSKTLLLIEEPLKHRNMPAFKCASLSLSHVTTNVMQAMGIS